MSFIDDSSNLEHYTMATGVGLVETVPGQPLLPFSSVLPNPHAGESIISSANVKNAAIIDMFDDFLLLLDTDGTTSAYNMANGQLAADYTYTAFSGGGTLNGMTVTDAKSNGKIIGAENGYYLVLNAAENGLELYLITTGGFVSQWSVTTPLVFGALNGVGIKDAVKNTHAVSGITFLGIAQTDLVFFNANDGSLLFYNHANFVNTFAGSTTTLAGAALTGVGGSFNGTLASAITGGRFLAVSDAELNFINATGELEQYGGLNGVYAGKYPVQPLEGPQVNRNANNSSFIDAADNTYVYLDDDGTTSIYNVLTRTIFADPRWKTFTGGDLNGKYPFLKTHC